MQARVKLGVAIPQTALERSIDVRAVRAYLERAEALGFDSVWVVEQILGAVPSLEPVELLAYAAALTERVQLGAAVLLTALRSPVHTAKSLATLDRLSGGRLVVGVGLGANPRVYPAFGIPAERRADRFAEGVRLMKRLWTEDRVTFEGRFYRLEGASVQPRPAQTPHPPLWFGGHHRNALRRAVELGDGFIGAGSISTAAFVEEMQVLRGLLRDAGRDPAAFPVGKRIYIAMDRDRARARRRLEEWFGAFYGRPELAEQVGVRGDSAECLDRLAEVVAGGAGLLLLNPVFDELEHLERFASEIAPKL